MKWLVKRIGAKRKTPTPPPSSFSQKSEPPEKTEKNTPSPISARGGQFDDTKPDRARFTIENVLDRYGGLLNMRRYLFAYSFILFATQLFINFWKTSLDIVRYDNVSYRESRGSPLCCCKPPERLRRLSNSIHEMQLDSKEVDTWYSVAFLVSAILCSVLERFGRRRIVLISLPLSTLSLFLLAVVRDLKVIEAMIFITSMSYAMTYLTFTTNMIEMLPRSMRMVGLAFIQMARTHPTILTSFYSLFPSDSMMIMIIIIASINIVAFGVAFKFGRDSLCHIVVTDRIVEADRRVIQEEKALLKEKNPHIDLNNLNETDSRFLKKTVQMITDDLAFAEDDDYTVIEFLKRMVRNKPFYRMIYCLGAIIFAGVTDGLCQVYLKELDLAGTVIVGHKIVAKVCSVAGLVLIRKWSRLRAAKTMMALIVVCLTMRGSIVSIYSWKYGYSSLHFVHSLTGPTDESVCEMKRRLPVFQILIVQYDSNYCTSIVIRHERQIGMGVLTLMLYLLNDINIYAILLNVGEQAPSILRVPITSFYLLLMETVKDMTKSKFGKFRVEFLLLAITAIIELKDTYRVAICSTGLCILMGVGLFFRKVLDEDSFSVFMNDLVKDRKTGKSQEISQPSDETSREDPKTIKNSPTEAK